MSDLVHQPRHRPAGEPETCPSDDLLDAWLGDSMYDLQFRPGADLGGPAGSPVDTEDEDAVAAARHFRDTLGRFASGVTVVTAISGGAPVGLTCQSFSSVSLNPPLVLFIPSRTSGSWPAIQRAGRFCVNFLAEDQADLSNQMASKVPDKFAGVEWEPAPATGSPRLAGAVGYVDCAVHTVHEAGDHYVVIGRVLDLGYDADVTAPLLFFRGKYATTEQ